MNTKKCIVLDLDDTLWGGVVGEDGLDGIRLSIDGVGASFIAFQQALLDLYDRGILLAINSRNNPEDALEVIRSHPNMILKEHNFAAMRINWEDKVTNIRLLAQELNIGLDSMVFLDDDPTNRALVRQTVSEVEVPELPSDPAEYTRLLISLPYFASTAITDEDKMRGNLYVTERLRKESEKSFTDTPSFLKSLGLHLQVYADDPMSVARLAQLTEKTNQFNVNKQPLTSKKFLELMRDPESTVFHARLVDRFGDYGIIAVAIARHQGSVWHVPHFLMSCRVIGRGIEAAFLSAIAEAAKKDHAEKVSIEFVQTEKNKPAQEFVEKYFKNGGAAIGDIIDAPVWLTITYGKI